MARPNDRAFQLRLFEGDHFFLQQSEALFMQQSERNWNDCCFNGIAAFRPSLALRTTIASPSGRVFRITNYHAKSVITPERGPSKAAYRPLADHCKS